MLAGFFKYLELLYFMGKVSGRKRHEKTDLSKGISSDIEAIPAIKTPYAWTRSVTLHIIFIALLGLLVYSNTFNVPFQWDDRTNIIENPIIKDLGYFISLSWADDFVHSGSLMPRFMGYLTFALNYSIHGLDVTGYHVVNLAVHIFNALLVYFLVVLTFRTPFVNGTLLKKHDRYIALFSALLFVSHPVQTQAVTYIVQRLASLATMFYLTSLVFYVKWRLTNPPIPPLLKGGFTALLLYCSAVLSCVLAMFTKQIAFTLPLIIALYEFFFFAGKAKRRLIYLAPFLLTMLIIPLTLIDVDKPLQEIIGDASEKTIIMEMTRLDYFLTEFRVIVTYLRLLVLPVGQNLDYDYPLYSSFFEPQVLLSFLFLLGVFGLGVFLFRRSRITDHSSEFGVRSSEVHSSRITHHSSRLIAFGIFWFFITLSVESSIIPLHVIYEYRVYLPGAGAFLALGTGAFLLVERLNKKATRNAAVAFLIVLPLVLSAATYARNSVWKSEISLWKDTAKKSPEKARPHNNLALAYVNKGLASKAIEHYLIALRIEPDNAGTFNNLGNIYKSKGSTDKAIEHYNPEAHNNLGNAFFDKGLYVNAIEHYKSALSMKPYFAEAHNNLGAVYRKMGLIDKAIEHYQIALRIEPGFIAVHKNLGNAYGSKGLYDKAITHLQTALRSNPDSAGVHYYLGLAYFEKGFMEKARREFEAVIQINPNDQEARKHLDEINEIRPY
jgi:tetratricopeptide (TPR) repeat protein